MNIDKAIEILKDRELAYRKTNFPYRVDAIKLGIEALKQIQAGRVAGHILWKDTLPGETKE